MAYLVSTYGYFGVFLVELISSSSILFPLHGYLVVIAAGTVLNPFLVAICAGLGAAVGELTGYILGVGGGKLIGKAELESARRMYTKYGLWTIFLFASTPLPFDVIGILCGTLRVDLRIFFLMTFVGKASLYTLLAYTGRGTLSLVKSLLRGQIDLYSIAFLTLLILTFLVPLIYWRLSTRKPQTANEDEASFKGG
jgi:membrane protein YqaA with SNARE-associated domain